MSNKFTGITSAGSAIPVYDKDAHSALEQKLDTSAFSSVSGEFATVDDVVAAVSGKADTSAIPSLDGYATEQWVGEQGYLTEVPESAVSGFATHEEVESATSGKANTSGVIEYQTKPLSNAIYAGGNSLANVDGIFGKPDSNFYISPSSVLQVPKIITATTGGLTAGNLTANENGVSGGRTSTSYSGSSAGAFRIYANQNRTTNPYIQLIGAASYSGNGVFVGVDSACGIDSNGRKTWNIKNGGGDTVPSFSMEGAATAHGNGVFIDVNGASGVDYAGNVKWQVGGPAAQLFNGGLDKKPAILLVSPPTSDQYSAQWSAAPYISAGSPTEGITLAYGPKSSAPYAIMKGDELQMHYTSAHASFGNHDVKVSTYTAYNDPNKIEWSLTGSVQKREIECDSATSAITAIAGSAIGGKEYSAGANIDITDEVISGKDWSEDIAGATSGLMQTSGLEYDGDKISGYMGSAFAGGGEVPEGVMVESAVEYNAVNEISGYNGSAIAQYGAEKQWLVHDDTLVHAANSAQYALGVNLSAVAKLLGVDETVIYENTTGATVNSANVITLNESLQNFEMIKIIDNSLSVGGTRRLTIIPVSTATRSIATNDGWFDVSYNPTANTSKYIGANFYSANDAGTQIRMNGSYISHMDNTGKYTVRNDGHLYKIIGVHRISG